MEIIFQPGQTVQGYICMDISLSFPTSYWRGHLSPQSQEENHQGSHISEEVACKRDTSTPAPSLTRAKGIGGKLIKVGCGYLEKTKKTRK